MVEKNNEQLQHSSPKGMLNKELLVSIEDCLWAVEISGDRRPLRVRNLTFVLDLRQHGAVIVNGIPSGIAVHQAPGFGKDLHGRQVIVT